MTTPETIDNHSHPRWNVATPSHPTEYALYVCICNGVTDRQIREAAAAGCSSVAELTMRTGCGATCGTCLDVAAALLEPARFEREAARFPVQMLDMDVSRAA